MSAPRRRVPLCLLLLAVLAPPGLEAQPFKARGPGGDLLLVRSGDAYRVESAAGDRTVLPLPPEARINDFRAAGDGWLAAAVVDGEGGQVIVVLRGRSRVGGREIETLAAPGRGNLLREPLLLTAGAELGGLVWLGGDAGDRLAVRAARWRDGGWEEPQTVSPPGRGTQIALAAATLADGSWLAAWAAFDGDDDEILWSRSAGDAWSAPRPVAADNRVPDITPHLAATADGALLAWSRYDGNDYRVVLARFDGDGWSEPATVGPRGSVDPAFESAENPLLVYLQAVPPGWGAPGWAVIELDADGTVRRRSETAAGDRRPVVSRLTDEGVILRWGDGRSSAAGWRPAPPEPR